MLLDMTNKKIITVENLVLNGTLNGLIMTDHDATSFTFFPPKTLFFSLFQSVNYWSRFQKFQIINAIYIPIYIYIITIDAHFDNKSLFSNAKYLKI